MRELLEELSFCLRFYPLECALVAIISGGTGLFIGAAVMRWALS